MKIVEKKVRGYRSYIEKYDLSGAYAGKHEIPIGVILLYILSKRKDIDSIEITAESKGDIGEERNIIHISKIKNADIFEDLDAFSDFLMSKDLDIWELRGKYVDEEITIAGKVFGTMLSVCTPLTSELDIMPLMSTVEKETYSFD